MPIKAIVSAAADEPYTGRLGWEHPLAAVAARNCQKHATPLAELVGGVACRLCWDDALVADFVFALEHDLPLLPVSDPFLIDEIAVERAMRGDAVELTELERAEVRRRLAEVRVRRNRGYRFVCSRAAAARRADGRTFTHPDVLTVGVREGWADPQADPSQIDWAARLEQAAIPYRVVDGRPVNPCQKTAVRFGRNELGHWGEKLAADAIVLAADVRGGRWLLMVERGDGHGWALPGGMVDEGESPAAAAVRELAEETGLVLPGAVWQVLPARYVPDPRASDEAWIVTVASRTDLGTLAQLPSVVGADDAARAVWVRADSFAVLTAFLAERFDGRVFPAHVGMLSEVL